MLCTTIFLHLDQNTADLNRLFSQGGLTDLTPKDRAKQPQMDAYFATALIGLKDNQVFVDAPSIIVIYSLESSAYVRALESHHPLISLTMSFSYQRHVIIAHHPLFYDALICRLPHVLIFYIVDLMPERGYVAGPEPHLVLNGISWCWK